MKEIIFVLLEKYADWEAAPLAAALNEISDFCIKTASLTKEPVHSIGGFTTIPDYDLTEAMNKNFAGIVLIGGYAWKTTTNLEIESLITKAIANKVVVGAICDASRYLSSLGVLNDIKHTGNTLEGFLETPNTKYIDNDNFICEQAISANNIVTANGTAPYEFGKEMLSTLNAMTVDKAEQWYKFNKLGYYEAIK